MANEMDDTRRSGFFAAILVAANVYLIGFAADAAISVFDDFLAALTGSHIAAISAVRALVASLVVLASFVMLLLVVFVPRLPKLVLLPLIAFAIWAGLGAAPFVWPGENQKQAMIVLAVVQAAFAVGAFLYVRARSGKWLLSQDALPRAQRPILAIATSFVAAILIVPALAGGLLVLNVAGMIQGQTGGYIQFTSQGLDLQETVMRKDGKEIRLIGMIHIGEPRFYQALYAGFPKDALILEEGVSDRQRKLAGNFSYHRFARVLGLEQQPRLGGPANVSSGAAASSPESATPDPAPAEPRPKSNVMNPDIDVSEFNESTLRFLLKASGIYQSRSFVELLTRFNALSNNVTEEEIKAFYDDVVHKRNARVLVAIDQESPNYDTIIVPWGALHMPEIEEKLKERGYAVASRRTMPLVRYGTIFRQFSAGA